MTDLTREQVEQERDSYKQACSDYEKDNEYILNLCGGYNATTRNTWVKAVEELKAQLTTSQARVKELEDLCAQVYQVVGVLASDAGQWDKDETNKVLDNLSMASASKPLPHRDLLPYPCQSVDYATLTARLTQVEEALKRLISCFEEDTPHLAEIDGDHSYHLTGMPHESLTLARQALTPAAEPEVQHGYPASELCDNFGRPLP